MHRLSGCCRKAVTILAAQSSSSRQPTLSCKPLYSFRLHYITGLRKLNTLHSIPATFLSAACSPPAASIRLACGSLRAAVLSQFLNLPVMPTLRSQKLRQNLAVNSSCKTHSFLMLFFAPPSLHSQRLAPTASAIRSYLTHCIRFSRRLLRAE